ncbi:MAG TPA: hypothetical protein VFZ65_22545 [Planctomycetota bacterium]|nr:hypothetical protein [Planctomycetota bacterium]
MNTFSVCAVCLLGPVLYAQDLTTLRGLYGFGDPSALAVDAAGTRAYVGESAAISVLDLSVLAVPLPPSAVLARFSVDASIEHLELDETHQRLFVAGGSFGLLSIDLASPGHVVTTHDDPGDLVCFDVALTPSYVLAVFGAANASLLRIYDRTTLAPVSTAALGTGTAFAVAIEGTFAYVAMGTGGLARVDFANALAPSVQPGPVFPTSVFGEPARARDIVVSGGRIYVAVDGLGLVAARTSLPWTPAMPYTALAMLGAAVGGGTATLYAHRVDASGASIWVGANTKAGREADGGPFTSYGPMNYSLAVGGVVTPGPMAQSDALVEFQLGPTGLVQVAQIDVPAPWRALVARTNRLYDVHAFTGTFVRSTAAPNTVLASYRGAVYQPAEAFLSLRDPDLVLSGQDGAGSAYTGLLDIADPDAITAVPGTAPLGSFGLWFDAHWLDSQPSREWFVGNAADSWRLYRFDTTQPGANTHWDVTSPDDPPPGFNNGRNYWLSWLDGDLLLLTRAGTRWGLVGYSKSALQAAAATSPSGTTLATAPLWQLETHFAGELDQAQTWRCRTFSLPSGQRIAAIAAGFHTAPGPDETRPQVVLYDISAGTAAPPAFVSRILGPNLEGNAMAVATERIGAVTYLFVVDFGHGLHVYDVSNPLVPLLVGGWTAPNNVFDGRIDHATDIELERDPAGGLHAYVTLWRRGLVELDVSNPATFAPPLLAEVDTPGLPYGIAIRDVDGSRGLVLADHQAGLRLYGHYAKWQSLGGGCAGPGGMPSLQVVTAPVLGGTFQLQVNDLAGGLAVMVTGLGPASLPLQPLGLGFGAGCTLLAAPDALEVLLPSAGSAVWAFAVPSSVALRGVQLFSQAAELAATSALSNGGVGTID